MAIECNAPAWNEVQVVRAGLRAGAGEFVWMALHNQHRKGTHLCNAWTHILIESVIEAVIEGLQALLGSVPKRS
eukprot:scaffold34424_cov27-Tisochrysis_lutea.AAC.1